MQPDRYDIVNFRDQKFKDVFRGTMRTTSRYKNDSTQMSSFYRLWCPRRIWSRLKIGLLQKMRFYKPSRSPCSSLSSTTWSPISRMRLTSTPLARAGATLNSTAKPSFDKKPNKIEQYFIFLLALLLFILSLILILIHAHTFLPLHLP